MFILFKKKTHKQLKKRHLKSLQQTKTLHSRIKHKHAIPPTTDVNFLHTIPSLDVTITLKWHVFLPRAVKVSKCIKVRVTKVKSRQ